MNNEVKKIIIEEYQCPGCVGCDDMTHYKERGDKDISCQKHCAGTRATFIGRFFLGMPVGFCRIGTSETMKIEIYENLKDYGAYDKFNIPVWKYQNEKGHMIIRGIKPRLSSPFLHIILNGSDFYKIDCLEITDKDIKEMD